ncbi:MAG: LPS export ABC transporter permease LptF [Alphaproteobacteria bacterium]|nr:LPS export ABC transporter permease LptF [Alphaproteobacteria bacterium]
MKILNKYILKQLFVGFTLVLVSMTTLVWLTQSLKMIDMIVTKGVSVGVFLKMTLLVLPNFIQILSPLALFAVTLFVYTRMQADKELMVMKAVGMSNAQIMCAPLIFAGILTILGYIFSLFVVPYANTQMREMKWQIKNNLSHVMLQEGQFNSFKNLTVYIRERLADGVLKGIIVYDIKNNQRPASLIAEQGVVFQGENETQVRFEKGMRQELDRKTQQFSVLKFDTYTMSLGDSSSKSTRTNDVREYSLTHLLKANKNEAGSDSRYRKFKVEAMKRLLQPIYNISFVFLAMFGVLAGYYNRRGQVGQINMVVFSTLIVQSLALAFENMAAKNLWLMPLMVLNVVVPIVVIYLILLKDKKLRVGFLKIGSFIGALLISSGVMATPVEFNVDKDAPVNFEADAIEYNKNKNEMTAIGNVVIEQNGTVLKTDKVVFNRAKGRSYIPGDIVMTSPDGTITTAKNVELSDGLKNAVSQQISIQIIDGTYVAADSMKRTQNGTLLYLRQLTYTPCERCQGKAPLWQLRANRMKHDVPNKTLSFIHSFLEVKDIPIFYFPYLQTPDFTVKRKTGLLSPSLRHSSTMGNGIELPFFINVADNQNLLVSPTISVSHMPLIIADYQGFFKRGTVNLQLSGTKDDDDKRDYQGHVRASFEYDVDDKWRLSGNLFRTSSDTYFRKYKIPNTDDNQSFLTSHIAAERFGTRNYINLSGLSFQSLRAGVNSRNQPIVIPRLQMNYQTTPLMKNGIYAFTEVNSAIIHNRERFKSDRLSLTQGFRMPYISSYGAVYDVIGTVRFDGYSVDTGKYAFGVHTPDDTYTTGRVYPNLSVEASYPMSMVTKNTTQVFKPIVMGVVSPNRDANASKIPDMDSLVFDFDDTNLFSRNRYTGYDRVETGARLNYGAEWTVYTNRNAAFAMMFGQSYRFKRDEIMGKLMGEDKNFSDYVGRMSIDYDNISLAYRFRLDENKFTPKKNEITLVGGGEPLRLGVDYVYLKDTWIGNNFYPSREEILLFGSSRLSRQWSLSGLYRYDLAKEGGPVEASAILRYDNECLAVIFDLSKEFTEDRDYTGETSFMVKFELKTLGGI